MVKNKFPFKFFILLFVISIFTGITRTESHGLRTLKKGDAVKDYELTLLSDGSSARISELSGEKGLLIIFWATWSNRSKSLLTFAETKLKELYGDEGISIIGINVEGETVSDEELEKIHEVARELNISFSLAIDRDLVMFDEIGVITNPTTVLVDRKLILVDAFPGFPSIARDEIPGMVNAFLGIKEEKPPLRAQYFLDHQPKNKALLRYNLGRNIYKRYLSLKGEMKRVPAGAVKQLAMAQERDPGFYSPYLLQAVIYHKTKEEDKKTIILQEINERDFKEPIERIDLAYMYILLDMREKAKEMVTTLKEEIPEETEFKLLEALFLTSGGKGEEASVIFKELIESERGKRVFPFDLAAFVDEESGMIMEDPLKSSHLLAEKILNISKK